MRELLIQASQTPAWEIWMWVASMVYFWCCVPQFIRIVRLGNAESYSVYFLLMYLFGKGSLLIHITAVKYLVTGFVWQNFASDVMNITFMAIFLWYKLSPRVYNELEKAGERGKKKVPAKKKVVRKKRATKPRK